LLLEGKKAIEDELVDRSKVFTNAKKLDAMNEAMPNSPSTTSSGSGGLLAWWMNLSQLWILMIDENQIHIVHCNLSLLLILWF